MWRGPERWIDSTCKVDRCTRSQAKPCHCSSTQGAGSEVHGRQLHVQFNKSKLQQPQMHPRSPLGEAPSPPPAMRPFKRGPLPPTDFLLDHVRVELLVPRAVERVGDVQPLAVHAELHLTRATVHPLALEAQQRAVMSRASFFQQTSKSRGSKAERQSRMAASPPNTGRLLNTAGTLAAAVET